jgi:hypothetical protein
VRDSVSESIFSEAWASFSAALIQDGGRRRSAAQGAILGRGFHDFKGFRRHFRSFAVGHSCGRAPRLSCLGIPHDTFVRLTPFCVSDTRNMCSIDLRFSQENVDSVGSVKYVRHPARLLKDMPTGRISDRHSKLVLDTFEIAVDHLELSPCLAASSHGPRRKSQRRGRKGTRLSPGTAPMPTLGLGTL